jgi:eukaryotic-like serine/threonine-protein kinase
MVADDGEQRRIWHFANVVFDEASWKLTVGGTNVDIDVKPLEVLQELLEHAREVVSKDQLFDAVWPHTTVVEASLTTAISKLRDALQDSKRNIIQTVPRLFYKLVATVDVSAAADTRLRYDFEAGDTVPRRTQWKLVRALGITGHNDVWLARQVKAGEQRVFKFASTPFRLRALKREATLARILLASLGERPYFARVLEWNFDEPPMFIESAYGGDDLVDWAKAKGGLAAVLLREKLRIVIAAARTTAAADSVGVLHKDIKPANLLIDTDG